MGFHVCEYCTGNKKEMSSGDVILRFANGRAYMVPDMILHYIADHKWLPPDYFIDDVLRCALADVDRFQSKSTPERVGYLSGDFPWGWTPQGFFESLWSLMNRAEKSGQRVQTRSLR